ncbi:YfhD family protein [Bacillaceae bacterium W0354]
MGRDEHKNSKRSRKTMAQTPKNQLSDGRDIEYDQEFADENDLEAQARSNAADERAKNNKR